MSRKDNKLAPTSCTAALAEFLRQQAVMLDTSVAQLVRTGLRMLDENSEPAPENGQPKPDRIPMLLLNEEQKALLDKLLAGKFKNRAQVVRAAAAAYEKSVTIQKESVT